MAIRADSYSTTTGVLALTKHLIEGQSAFNTTTRPTKVEVEGFIDEASGLLNISLRKYGLAPSAVRANTTAKLSCDMWVRTKAVKFVELTHPTQGFLGDNETRAGFLDGLLGDADNFAMKNALGFKREGVAVADPMSQGIHLEGTQLYADRTDTDDDALESPFFRRRLFDNP